MSDDVKVIVEVENKASRPIKNITKSFEELRVTLRGLEGDLSGYSEDVRTVASASVRGSRANTQYSRSYAETAKRALVAFNAVALYKKAVDAAFKLVKGSLKTYADFEKALSNVKAIVQPTGDEFAKLEAEARQLGETTAFTASQAVEAFTELGKAGFEVSEVLDSADDVLALAAATTISLSKAATITAQTMNQFSEEGVDAAIVADTFAKAASSSALSSETLAASLVKAGTTAGQLGIELSDTAAALGVLADVGIKGGAAGTQLNRALILMNNSSSKVGKTLKALNVENEDFITKLEALQSTGMSANDIFEQFGFIAGKSAIALINNADAVAELDEKLEAAKGTAEEMAETQLDNLAGDVTKLSSAFGGLQIAIGKAFGPVAREVVQKLTDTMGQLKDIMNVISEAGFDEAWQSNAGSIELVVDQMQELESNTKRVNELSSDSIWIIKLLSKEEEKEKEKLKERNKELESHIKLRTGDNAVVRDGTVFLQNLVKVQGQQMQQLTTVGKLQSDINRLRKEEGDASTTETQLKELARSQEMYVSALLPRLKLDQSVIDLQVEQIKIGNELATSVLAKVEGNAEATAKVKAIISQETAKIKEGAKEREKAEKDAIKAVEKAWADHEKWQEKGFQKQQDQIAADQLKRIQATQRANEKIEADQKKRILATQKANEEISERIASNRQTLAAEIASFDQTEQDRVHAWANERIAVEGATKDQIVAIEQERADRIREIEQELMFDRLEMWSQGANSAASIIGSVGSMMIAASQRDTAAQVADINAREKAEIDAVRNKNKTLTAEEKKILRIQEQAEKKRVAIEKDAAKDEHKIRMFQWSADLTAATAAAALAVARALATPPAPNFPLAGLAGLAGGAQVASVAAAKPQLPQFADGGMFDGTGIVAGTSFNGDKVNANLNSGEVVLNNPQQRNVGRAIMDVANGNTTTNNSGGNTYHIVVNDTSGTPEITAQAVVTALEEAEEQKLIEASRFPTLVGA